MRVPTRRGAHVHRGRRSTDVELPPTGHVDAQACRFCRCCPSTSPEASFELSCFAAQAVPLPECPMRQGRSRRSPGSGVAFRDAHLYNPGVPPAREARENQAVVDGQCVNAVHAPAHLLRLRHAARRRLDKLDGVAPRPRRRCAHRAGYHSLINAECSFDAGRVHVRRSHFRSSQHSEAYGRASAESTQDEQAERDDAMRF